MKPVCGILLWLGLFSLLSVTVSQSGDCACEVCGGGQYRNESSGVCVDCLPGFFCPSYSNISFPCEEGTFANNSGQEFCTICPAGHQCKKISGKGAVHPYPCPAGFYSRQGESACTPCDLGQYANISASSACLDCPAGHECSDQTSNPKPCANGTYSTERSTICVACLAGYFSVSDVNIQCTICPAGHNCFDPASEPEPCAIGTFSQAGSETCTSCLDGYYTNKTAQSSCIECPAGHQCSTNEPIECPPGTVSLARALTCTPCINGLTYSSQPGQSSCLPCQQGYLCSNASSEPVDIGCEAGWYLHNGSECQRCSPGSYSESGSKSCLACPAGRYCPDFASKTFLDCLPGTFSIRGSSNCTQCAMGYYQNASSQASCILCPAGLRCPNPSDLPVVCENGTYSLPGSTLCIDCQPGTYQSELGQDNCTQCPAGHKCPNSGTTEPIKCSNGTVATVGQANCELCTIGRYADSDNMQCLPCPVGHMCPSPDVPIPCNPGSYAPMEGLIECTLCEAGSYASENASTICKNCTLGHECIAGSVAPTICWAGTYSDIVGLSQCKDCEVGTYNVNPEAYQCYPCPGGSSCLQVHVEPEECPPGTYSGIGISICTACARGEYTTTNGSSICNICPADHTCQDPTSDPVLCEDGLFSHPGSVVCSGTEVGTYYDSSTGTTVPCAAGTFYNSTDSSCMNCPAGFYCIGYSAPPAPCVNSTYQDAEGQSSCRPCPAGQQCLDPASPPEDCTAGQSSVLGQVTCLPCQSGTYSDPKASVCTPCPAGSECSTGSPVECDAGSFSNVGDDICTSCREGTHTNGVKGASFCQPCPAGFSCMDVTAAPQPCLGGEYSFAGDFHCMGCPGGFYCPTQTAYIPCSSGTYSTGNATICDSCPGGQSCLDPANAPVNCDEGQYSLDGDPTCLTCPAGSQCQDQTVDPVTCSTGEYSYAGNGTCYECPVGYICKDPTVAPLKCAFGSTTNGLTGQTDCMECPSGKVCQDAADVPFICPDGTYSPVGESECIACPAGVSCSGSDTTLCDPGTYSILGQSNCTGCPPGFACPYSHQAVVIQCQNGTYALENQTACTICPPGSACPSPTMDDELPCGTGFYSTSGQDECSECPAGMSCQQPDGSENRYCIPGTYSLSGDGDCKSCTAGFACPYTNSNVTVECGNGTYSGAGQTTCTRCAAGYACPTANAANGGQTSCAVGTYSSGGQTTCTDCVAGFACPLPFAAHVIACTPGTYSEANKDKCTDCPPGEQCPSTNATGTPCDDGYYSLGRQTQCTECPAGYQCSTKTSVPVICLQGTYSEAAAMACDPCNNGFLCGPGSTTPTPASGICPIGYYCDGNSPTPCPVGTYGSTPQLNVSADCSDCPEGFFCGEGTEGYPGVVNICPRGAYCPAKTETSNQFPCPGGTFGPYVGQPNATVACLTCPEGRYCTPGSAKPGQACPRGHYCPSGTSNFSGPQPPEPCVGGTYTAEEGARVASACVDCPAGYFCEAGTTDPAACPNGTYQPDIRQPSNGSCLPCLAGMACTTTALTQPDQPCQPGHYCPAGTLLPNDNPCPAGTFTDLFNLTAPEECDACPIRFACLEGTGGTIQKKSACAPGYYCKNSTQYPTQWPCPAGSYSNRTNLAYLDECWECPKGYYCVNGSTEPNDICPAGYYCPPGTKYATEYPCSSGLFSNQTGNVRKEDCDDCVPGFFCGEGTSEPEPCPAGTFNDNPGAMNDGSCKQCTSGYYCPVNGTADPLPCGKGYFSGLGQTNCTLCTAGYYCDEDMTTDTQLPNKTCPPGMHCSPGTAQAPNLYNSSCPAGFYCERGSIAAYPIPCPNGTFSGKTGLKSETNCTDCTEGTYCDVTNLTSPAGDCPPGYYCLTKTGDRHTYPCPAGTYLNNTAAISADSCVKCTSGKYCPSEGTSDPLECTLGNYCTPGSSTPEPCPAGTFGNQTGTKSSIECTPCLGGKYCLGSGNTIPTGDCDAGYYCVQGSDTPTPNGGSMGDLCFAGGYCPAGSPWPRACSPGSYSPYEMATSELNCTSCPPGKFCSGESAAGITGDCAAGSYCTGGASTPTQFPAEPGYYAKEGASNQTICSCGYFNSGYNEASCKECPAGQYCPQEGTVTPTPCEPGYYCPQRSSRQFPCDRGTYNDEAGQVGKEDCNPCREGYYCSEIGQAIYNTTCEPGFWCGAGSTTGAPNGSEPNGGPCPKGYFCDAGTPSMYSNPCPPGTYNNKTGALNVSYCTPCDPGRTCIAFGLEEPDGYCDPGYYCRHSATAVIPPADATWGGGCLEGYHCPQGSGDQEPCPSGTYQNVELQENCQICPPGEQCTGYNNRTACAMGFYCPEGTGNDPGRCPFGTYGDVTGMANMTDCKECDKGHYCNEFNLTAPYLLCDAGHYCKYGVDVSNPGTVPNTGVGGICPPGSYCVQGTDEPTPCPPGTYNELEGLQSEATCQGCPPGKYCETANLTTPTGDCDPGFFCSGRANSSAPADSLCPIGKHCPGGATVPLDCSAGTYSNVEGLAVCIPCQAGFYCPNATQDPTAFVCPKGYYCPEATADYQDFPCPPGTYGVTEQAINETVCRACDPGKYCIGNGTAGVSGDCEAGFYCLTMSSSPRPSSYSNFTDGDCVCPANDTAGECPVGYFCEASTGMPEPCTGGSYCATAGLSSPTNLCDPGFYCESKAIRADPRDGITGNVCPAGSYCERGSTLGTLCSAGTYNNGTGAVSADNCTLCPAGYFCPDRGQVDYTDLCPAGYYCPEGRDVATTFACDPGYMCPLGSPDQELCESGYYQDVAQQATCKPCPAGYYCSKSDGPITDGFEYDCPLGSFCPNGTKSRDEFLCPVGTYGARLNLQSADQCDACPQGRYCGIQGIGNDTVDSYPCAAGYLCVSGANISNPTDGVTGDECPKGKYCLAGTTTGTDCPKGTFNNDTGKAAESECADCTPGYYCQTVGLEEPTDKCNPGYYCPGRNIEPASPDFNCTIGHHCPLGTPLPIPCEDGTYTTDMLQTMCTPCPAGSYCVDGINLIACPEGFFCPGSTGYDWSSCPPGTYSNDLRLETQDQCTSCDPGRFCSQPNATTVTGNCDATFYCKNGSSMQAPDGSDGVNGKCSPGFYCIAGTPTETPCDAGTYRNRSGGASQADCDPCPPGLYCESGSAEPTNNCDGGYYCIGGSASAKPNDGVTGAPCPTGFQCPAGSSQPHQCAAGTYNNLDKQQECFECMAGYYCPANSTSYLGNDCPQGYYCPNGTKDMHDNPCPPGTFGDSPNLQSLRDCSPCSPGQFCNESGLSSPVGKCAAGWYCTTCAFTSTPSDLVIPAFTVTSCLCPVRDDVNQTGGRCQPGYFCPEGSIEPQICTPGSYCETPGLENTPTGLCDAGFYCANGSSSRTPTDGITGNECPAGSYCEAGSPSPVPCDPGTFSNHTQNKAQSDCSICTAGYYCVGGMDVRSGLCAENYYCPEGQNVSAPSEYLCPSGHRCPSGSDIPDPCESGQYQGAMGKSTCDPCPAGYYCEAINTTGVIIGVSVPTACDTGYFCPEGTKYRTEHACPIGTFGASKLLQNISQCTDCPGGKYCDEDGLSQPKGNCSAGFYCIKQSDSPNPVTTTPFFGPCPTGSYCLEGDPVIYQCPNGTYNPNEEGKSIDWCLPCDGGSYCATPKLPEPTGNCTAGYYCPLGSTSDTEEKCPIGFHCPPGVTDPQPCPTGSYTNSELQSDCTKCSAGSFCNGTNIEDCPMGFYCPEGQSTATPCPAGTYNGKLGATHLGDCNPCTPGSFCPNISASAPEGKCYPGYYCRNASEVPNPPVGAQGDAGPCPAGFFCPEETGEPNPCDPGTFNPSILSVSADNCSLCTAGSYCNTSGLDAPTGPCTEGYYCVGGESNAAPATVTSTGGPCPRGSYCPTNSTIPVPCEGGTYAPNIAMPLCLDCPAGQYCPVGSNTTYVCPFGHYCVVRSPAPTTCSNGTFNNQTGGESESDCKFCPPGLFCPDRAKKNPEGPCAPGWYCKLGSWMEKPTIVGFNDSTSCACPLDGDIGGRCVAGQYCPGGSPAPIPCTAGYFCERDELSDVSGPCDAGHYCTGGSITAAPTGETYGDVCPTGHYCPQNSSFPTPCPEGRFSNSTMNPSEEYCLNCTAGWYCPGTNNSVPPSQCDPGCYCLSGSKNSCPAGCPNGAKCPLGSVQPQPCPSGFYQPDPGMSDCLVCQEGSYCDSREAIADGYLGVVTPQPCPAGFYCPNGTRYKNEFPCLEGTYSDQTGRVRAEDCLSCDGGFYCDRTNQTSPTGPCFAGYYCPGNSINATAYECPPGTYCPLNSTQPTPCPSGTYNPGWKLGSINECTDCDPGKYCATERLPEPTNVCFAGYYCSGKSSKPDPTGESFGDVCPLGRYCPANSSLPIECPSGTYNPDPQGTSLDDCLACDPASFCNGTGLYQVSGDCWERYYCDGNASTPTQHDCPPGHFCPPHSPSPLPCINGTYSNTSNADVCRSCPAGSYCVDSEIDPQPCPMGYYCLDGTGWDWQKCPTGTFNPVYGLSTENECTQCTAGSYCGIAGQPNVTGPCDPGYNCIIGVDVQNPNNGSNKGSGHVCQPGFQCPNGKEEPCPPGTFANVIQKVYCSNCTEGFYCPGNTIDPVSCISGHYCPSGTKAEKEFPCPAGTFNNETEQGSIDKCQPCTAGKYCQGSGNSQPTDVCDPGFYCSGGSDSKRPVVFGTDPGTGSNVTCTTPSECVCPSLADTTGGMCMPGYYCPRESPQPTPCDRGKFCPDYEMFEPKGNCSAGYYCDYGSISQTESNCTPGHYCEEGTGIPTGCPAGTYSTSYNNKRLSDCLQCIAGMYCPGEGNVLPFANCSAGYYCPEGSDRPDQVICETQHYCVEGSKNQTACELGTYQPNQGKSFCNACPSGRICDPNDGNLAPEPCPQGFYCPAGTEYARPCPAGTFGAAPQLASESLCTKCPTGQYCLGGAANTSGDCSPGYYCTEGAKEPDPIFDNVTNLLTGNSICPPGFYCTGPDLPQICPAGTYNEQNGSRDASYCLACPPGRYCPTPGLTDSTILPDCDPGFICVGGASLPAPTDATGYPCPAGFHCPMGTPTPLGCSPGSYSREGSSECSFCSPGKMCPYYNMSAEEDCMLGHFCPGNTSSPDPCPKSTFNENNVNAATSTDCLDCSPGQFCNDTGLVRPAGDCEAGYWCQLGSSTPTPTSGGSSYNGPCPVGRYCLAGATAPTLCPIGTMRNVTGAAAVTDCTTCSPGYYCENEGQSEPTNSCQCGSFCPGNTTSNSNPDQFSCPTGHFCPPASSQPQPCVTGTYQPSIRTCACDKCRPGFYCENALSGGEIECPAHNYCPEATPYPIPCPNGTYTGASDVGLQTAAECQSCPPGKYCTGGQIRGDCNEGYFCANRAYTPTGTSVTLIPCGTEETCVGACPAGFYCPTGIADPIPCPENTLRANPGASKLSDCMFCPAGFRCREGDPNPYPCPAGHYCRGINDSDCTANAGPQPCQANTYQNSTGATVPEDCQPCPPGYWCNETGLTDFSSSACALGYYCIGGGQDPEKCPGGTMRDIPSATNVSDCAPCTGGYYCPDPFTTGVTNINGIPCEPGYLCPEGSAVPMTCPPGFYCLEKTSVARVCPAGYFCPNGSSSFTICEYPFYCPNGTGDPLTCDIGYQPLNISGLRSELTVACMMCPTGSYRNSSEEDKCLPCPPGYYCPAGTGNYQENPCPNGHYCPEGGITSVGGVTGAPIPCPAGTYGAQAGSEFSVCQSCQPGMFNNLVGQTACFTCGSFASSTVGATECTCVGFNRAFQPSDGSCICMTGYVYYDEANQLQDDGNSQYSCQPIVDDRCGGDQARSSSTRTCVVPSGVDCTATCSATGGSGTFNTDLGICICDTVTFPEEITCSTGCYTMTSSLDSSSGVLSIGTTDSATGAVTTISVPNSYGPTNNAIAPGNTLMVAASQEGMFGTLPTTQTAAENFVSGNIQQQINDAYSGAVARRRRSVDGNFPLENDAVSSFFGRRLLQSTAAVTVPTTNVTVSIPDAIFSPIVCMQLDEMIIFNINLNPTNRNLSNYPVYVKNHLYNTNPSFDYGDFRQLQSYIVQSNLTVTNFAYIFTQSGIYVFADSQTADHQIIVNVLDISLVCPDQRIQPTTTISLASLGVAKQQVTNLAPNWALIAVLLGLFALCVLVLVVAIIVWRPRDAGIYPMRYWKPRYRAVGEPYVPPEKALVHVASQSSSGLGLVRERGEAEGAEDNVKKDVQLLEDFNVRTLYDKLEDQNLHLSSQLDKHQDSLQGFYEKMSNQTEGLKKMLNDLDVSELERAERLRAGGDGGPTVVNTSLQMDGLQRELRLAGGSSLREKELLRSLEILISKLNSGKITVSDEVIEDARRRLQGLESKSTATKELGKKTGSGMDEWKAQGQTDLIKAQQSDKLDLDRELLANEREAMSNLIIKQDAQKQNLMKELQDKLAFRIQGDLSEDEMSALLAEHEKDLEGALGALSKERQRQMNELKEQLAAKRCERAEQLKREHQKQCKEAGLPDEMSDDDSEGGEEDLGLLEKQLEAAILQESALASKEEADALAANEGVKLSKTFDDELNSMVDSGLITDDVREQVRKQILNQEKDLHDRMEKKREMQVKALRDRMAERKRRRIKKLKEKQEQEKSEADEVTPEMKERHAVERDALSAEIDAELAAMERNVIESVQSEHEDALKELHTEIINELGEKHGVDPVAQQELLERYRREADNFDHVVKMKRGKQMQDFKAKLAAKRARKAAEIQKLNEERMKKLKSEEEKRRLEELGKFQEEQDALKEAEQQYGGLDIPEVQVADNLEVQALAREQSRLLSETEEQQAADAERLAAELEKREREDEEALERKLKEEAEKALRETKAKHEAETRARTDLSDEQVQQLLAAHQQEIDEIEQALGKQQNRQRAALREKLAARRMRKTAALRSRQEIEKAREEVEQRKEMSQVQAKTMKEAERAAIIEGIEKNGSQASEKIIQKVLEKRHAQELKDLEAEWALKKKMMLEEALKTVMEQYQAERDAMLLRHEAELQKLEDEGLSGEELARRKAALLEKHKAELSSLDKKNKKARKEIEASVTGEWKLEHSQARLDLKEKHYQEFAEALRELAPSASQQKSAADADKTAKRLEEVKEQLEMERDATEKKFAQERQELEDEEKRRIAEAMKEFEDQLEDETEQEKIKAEKTLNTLAKRKEKLLKDKRQKMKEELDRAAAAGASEEEQKRILDQHEKDVENLTNKMDQERLRMQSKLQERMKKMRKEKLAAKKAELQQETSDNRKTFEDKQKAEMQKVKQKQVDEMQETSRMLQEKDQRKKEELDEIPILKEHDLTQTDAPPIVTQAPVVPAAQFDPNVQMVPYAGAMAAMPAMSEDDMHKMLASSPLFHTLQEIREVLHHEKRRDGDSSTAAFTGPDINSRDTELIPTPLSDLNVRELVAYKFGTFILALLRTRRTSHPPVNLLVAERVPARPDLQSNAFRGSFCFDEGNGILYIKRERLHTDSVGRLSLLLVHTMAHIACSELNNDGSSTFIEEFYQCLAALSDDLFFARYRGEPSKFEQGAHDVAKRDITDDVLDVKLPDRKGGDDSRSFHKRAVEERLVKYSQTAVSSTVRQELGNIETKLNQAKGDGTLNEIDKKLSTLAPPTPSTSQSVRRPDTRSSTYPDVSDSDTLNTEFVTLSREADDLHSRLASRDPQLDEVTVRNRLNNVQIRLSDVQRRLRTPQ